MRLLDAALSLRRPGPYQLQAAIAALHVQATSAEDTDWAEIAELYGALAVIAPSPVVDVNRAVAVGFADGAEAGLAVLAPLADDPCSAATCRSMPRARSCSAARAMPAAPPMPTAGRSR